MEYGKAFSYSKFEKWVYKNCPFFSKVPRVLKAVESNSLMKNCLSKNLSSIIANFQSPIVVQNLGK
jgi:hypothetical protein